MDGKNDINNRMNFIHFFVLLPLFLFITTTTGCMPKIGINVWPVPLNYSLYLPPNTKDDVLLFCLYDLENGDCLLVDDVQILSYPYNKTRLGMTGNFGLVSPTWKYGMHRSRHSVWLFTRKQQIIYIPLRPYGAFDDALSYFYVMNNPPITNIDFYIHKENNPFVYFNCVSPPYYHPLEEITKPDVQFLWSSSEDAKLVKEFWSESSACQNHLSVSALWKLHSIFGTTGQVLSYRRVLSPTEPASDANNHPGSK